MFFEKDPYKREGRKIGESCRLSMKKKFLLKGYYLLQV